MVWVALASAICSGGLKREKREKWEGPSHARYIHEHVGARAGGHGCTVKTGCAERYTVMHWQDLALFAVEMYVNKESKCQSIESYYSINRRKREMRE